MTTVSVRVGEEQASKLNEVASQIGNCSINSLVRDALDLWLEVEAPVLVAEAAAKKKRREGLAKRQAVIGKGAA